MVRWVGAPGAWLVLVHASSDTSMGCRDVAVLLCLHCKYSKGRALAYVWESERQEE